MKTMKTMTRNITLMIEVEIVADIVDDIDDIDDPVLLLYVRAANRREVNTFIIISIRSETVGIVYKRRY